MTSTLEPPVIAAYGGGVDSTAMLIECARRGERVDAVLFADTGMERPETYAFVKLFDGWLQTHGMPAIVTVQQTYQGKPTSIEAHSLRTKSLPGLAYGKRSCSVKFKHVPQKKWIAQHYPEIRKRHPAYPIVRLIGYDLDEFHRMRSDRNDKRWTYRYPLVDWRIDRKGCLAIIQSAGLPVPPKSACIFCPATKPREIVRLPCEQLARALRVERVAQATTKIGLGGTLGKYHWADVVKRHQSQMSLDIFGESPPLICGCFDGGEE